MDGWKPVAHPTRVVISTYANLASPVFQSSIVRSIGVAIGRLSVLVMMVLKMEMKIATERVYALFTFV